MSSNLARDTGGDTGDATTACVSSVVALSFLLRRLLLRLPLFTRSILHSTFADERCALACARRDACAFI